MTESPLVGFISPPGWYDPSAAEFTDLTARKVRTQQSIAAVHDMDYEDLANIAAVLPEVLVSGRMLGQTGADCVCMTGTPFGWAGTQDEQAMRQRLDLVSQTAGCPAVLVATAIVDALRALGVEKISVSAPYYTHPWREFTKQALEFCGFDVLDLRSAQELGLAPLATTIGDSEAVSGPETLARTLEAIMARNPNTQALVVTGASVRTMALVPDFEAQFGIPVIASDTALFWAILDRIKLGTPAVKQLGALGQLLKD